MPAPERYSGFAMLLHWLTFLLVALGAGIAVYMVDLQLSPAKLRFYALHKSVGVTVFVVAVTRLLWRLVRPVPPLPPQIPAWQRALAGASHALLYILILAIPLTGWLYSSAEGVQTVYLRTVPLPDLISRSEPLAALLKTFHVGLNLTLLVLVTIHIGAVIEHYLAGHGNILGRMLPFRRASEKP